MTIKGEILYFHQSVANWKRLMETQPWRYLYNRTSFRLQRSEMEKSVKNLKRLNLFTVNFVDSL